MDHVMGMKISGSGPDLLSAGPCSEKNVGPLLHLFFARKNWRPLFI